MTDGEGFQPEKAWWYVGRFMWGFSIAEGFVDEILVFMFSLNAAGSLILLKNLELAKKLTAIEIALDCQGATDHIDSIKRVRKLADIRNIIAHSSFTEEDDGISFDYIGSKRKLTVPMTEYKYSEFDNFHKQMHDLWNVLALIPSSSKSIADLDDYAVREIAEEISYSGNIIEFPNRPRTDAGDISSDI